MTVHHNALEKSVSEIFVWKSPSRRRSHLHHTDPTRVDQTLGRTRIETVFCSGKDFRCLISGDFAPAVNSQSNISVSMKYYFGGVECERYEFVVSLSPSSLRGHAEPVKMPASCVAMTNSVLRSGWTLGPKLSDDTEQP